MVFDSIDLIYSVSFEWRKCRLEYSDWDEEWRLVVLIRVVRTKLDSGMAVASGEH